MNGNLKRHVAALLCLCLMLALAGCGAKTERPAGEAERQEEVGRPSLSFTDMDVPDGINMVFPGEVSDTNGKYFFIAKAQTGLMYAVLLDGKGSFACDVIRVADPVWTKEEKTDFKILHVHGDYLFLIRTHEKAAEDGWTEETFVDVYSIADPWNVALAASYRLDGMLQTFARDGDTFVVQTGPICYGERVYHPGDELKRFPTVTDNGKERQLTHDDVTMDLTPVTDYTVYDNEIPNSFNIIMKIDMSDGVRMSDVSAVFGSSEKMYKELDKLIRGTEFRTVHTEKIENEDVIVRPMDMGYGIEEIWLYMEMGWPDRTGFRVGDLIYSYSYGLPLTVFSLETLSTVWIVPFM